MKLIAEQLPRTFYSHSSVNSGAVGAPSLTHTVLDGPLCERTDNFACTCYAGTQHIPGGYLPSQGAGAQKPNGNEYSEAHA